MNSRRRERELGLEKQYFTKVYKKNYKGINLNDEENCRFLSIRSHSNYLQITPGNLHNDSSSSSNLNLTINTRSNQSSYRYMDDSETASITSSLRRLGIDSPSMSSIMNLRNYSYLQSKENDCIDTILLKMQSDTKKPEPIIEPKIDETNDVAEKKSNKFLVNLKKVGDFFSYTNLSKVLKPIDFQSNTYLLWLAVVSFFYVYNIFSITIRYSFEYDRIDLDLENKSDISFNFLNGTTSNNTNNISSDYSFDSINSSNITDYYFEYIDNQTNTSRNGHFFERMTSVFENIIYKKFYWYILDYMADFIYLVDMFLIQTRIRFIKEGLWVYDFKSTKSNYLTSSKFIVI